MNKIEFALRLAKDCTYADEMTESAKKHLRGKIDEALEAYNTHVSNKRFFCDMESKKEERCETQCLLCTEIE